MMRLILLMTALLLAPALLANDDAGKPSTGMSLGETGLTFRTSDNSFEISLTTATQFRLTYHDVRGEGSAGDNGADFINFRHPGIRTFIHGHIFDQSFQYRLWLVWSWANVVRVEDCFFRWAPESYFNVTVGQMRVPATWEYLVDHERTGLPDRAVADDAFTQGWGKGVSISGRLGLYDTDYDQGLLTWEVGIYNGVLASTNGAQGSGSIGTNGVNVSNREMTERLSGGFRNNDWRVNSETFGQIVDSQMMIAGRVEFHPMGEVFRNMVDLGALDDTAAWFFMVGLAANWMSARVDGVGTFLGAVYYANAAGTSLPAPASGRKFVDAQILHITADGHFRWIGLSVNWALHYRTVNFSAKGRLKEFNLAQDQYLAKGVTDRGATIDIGYFILSDQLLIAARWSAVDFDEFRSRQAGTNAEIDGDSFGADTYEYGGGVTWYIHGDNLKIQLDYRYVTQQLPHGTSRSGATSRTVRVSDWRNYQEIRLQLQWIF